MRLLVWADGTRGDVLPVITLAAGLRRAGHDVRFATHPTHGRDAAAAGLEAVPIPGNDPRAVSGAVQAGTVGRGRRRFLRHPVFHRIPPSPDQLAGMVAMCRGADVVLSTIAFGVHPAEAVGAGFVRVALYPTEPTADRPHHLSRLGRSWGGPVNRLTHFLIGQLFWQPERDWINGWRRELGLRPWTRLGRPPGWPVSRVPHLFGYSPAVVPRPHDWGDHLEVTGYWWPGDARPEPLPSGLAAFLDGGPPPVVIGFGSLVDPRPDELRTAVRTAVASAGLRAVVLAGWSGGIAAEAGPGWYPVDWAPLAPLLPRCAAMIHHGGAGTTAEVLRAGLPSVAVPSSGEQGFWAAQLHRLRAAPPPVSRRDLTPERLAVALRSAVTDPACRDAARTVAGRLTSEDGVAAAVTALDRWSRAGLLSPVPSSP